MVSVIRILNLEDVPTDTELILLELRREGIKCQLERVDSRTAFIDAIAAFKPDLILSDYALPAFNGLEALRIAQNQAPDIPFVFISGTLGEEHAIETLKLGATDYVLKHRLSRLGPVIRRAFEESGERAARRQAQEALAKSEEMHRQIVETTQEGILTIDLEGATMFVNRRMAEMLGYGVIEMMNEPFLEFLDEDSRETASTLLRQESSTAGTSEIIFKHRDGSPRWATMATRQLFDDNGDHVGALVMINDITARRQAEDERNKLWAAVETGEDWVLITDVAGNIEYVNSAVQEISGYGRQEILGNNPRMFRSDKQDAGFFREMWNTILSGQVFRSIIINRKKDGTFFYLDQTITPLLNDKDAIASFVATGKDISERRRMEERLDYLAYNDVLTGLANRTLFFDRLHQTLSIPTSGSRQVVVAIVDPQRFKYINETYGVLVGDEMLQEMAKRLSTTVRPGDTVARYGGNSFSLLLNEIDAMRDAILVIERVFTVLSTPYLCNDEEIIIGFSMGIAVSPSDSNDSKRLMQCAESALFKAKEQRGNSYRFYTSDMNIMAGDFLAMERDLYHAVANKEFVLHYQRYFDIKTGLLKGMEALIRWNRPGKGLLPPGDFIHVLEETGLIVKVGDWVIQTACRQLAEWREAGFDIVPVSVNLSPSQFRQENLVERIKGHLEQSKIETDLLTIEITENIFVSDVEYTRRIFEQLRALGLRLSIDDFGTGYSSLSYLARLPLNNLKIDVSFIRDIARDPKSYSIVKVIISMARELGMQTIAEGVEHSDQLAILEELGCDLVQGYCCGRGLPGDETKTIFKPGHF
ncbi:EAL domain-containing protein [Pelotalea chapellei]|uniref:EAL domain-containing protein n=1 Tax=Pelotalea chapellei TaxID=44671 RepID=A0ABS5UB27_9BACT|nr:EAL domain-containing protein [Pelotalea chapellei]MBT1072868.1 EAL domain-containing protein [Pelotalea chapellei]